MNKAACAHFPCLEARKAVILDLTCTKYVASIQKLSEEFTNRFVNFRKYEKELKLLNHLKDGTGCYQMELIDLQSDIQ